MRKESDKVMSKLQGMTQDERGKWVNAFNGAKFPLNDTQVPETKDKPTLKPAGGKEQHSTIDCLAWVQGNSNFLSMAAIAKHIDCDRHNFTRYMKTGTLPSKYVPKLVSFVNVLLNSI